MTDQTLKPCMCCGNTRISGGSEAVGHEMYAISRHYMSCEMCKLTIVQVSHNECVKKWNTRHHPICSTCKYINSGYLEMYCDMHDSGVEEDFYCKYHEAKND